MIDADHLRCHAIRRSGSNPSSAWPSVHQNAATVAADQHIAHKRPLPNRSPAETILLAWVVNRPARKTIVSPVLHDLHAVPDLNRPRSSWHARIDRPSDLNRQLREPPDARSAESSTTVFSFRESLPMRSTRRVPQPKVQHLADRRTHRHPLLKVCDHLIV